jgi:hypothetical protein
LSTLVVVVLVWVVVVPLLVLAVGAIRRHVLRKRQRAATVQAIRAPEPNERSDADETVSPVGR